MLFERELLPPNEKTTYISESEELVASGYAYENIDVVGGPNVNQSGTQFYYQTILGNEIAVISMQSETRSGQSIQLAPVDVDNPYQFYATKYCPNSVVLYLLIPLEYVFVYSVVCPLLFLIYFFLAIFVPHHRYSLFLLQFQLFLFTLIIRESRLEYETNRKLLLQPSVKILILSAMLFLLRM